MNQFRWPPPPDGTPRRVRPRYAAPRSARPAPLAAATELVATPHGVTLERLVTGIGDPVTIFAHGLAQGIAETRVYGSGVTGRRVFFQFRGHGRSDAPEAGWTYADLARDLRTIADLSGATRALGVSLGAGALCRLLVESPNRFERLVFVLPAVLDHRGTPASRDRITTLLEALASGDIGQLANQLVAEVPKTFRNAAPGWAYVRQRLDSLLRDGLAPGVAAFAEQTAVANAAVLSSVTAPALVIGCLGDELHPVSVAEELAAVLPGAELQIYQRPALLWTERADLRERITSFLNQ
ncbi:alpha/beta fold hydrolase [Hamadaea tsunoensis]|uniref:alpha/beta fold hydrolase n=1 Tax=Hamadaea tsunoensis TaxID=53368 RepID=UPI000427CD5D|nr:alpha/beta fold hydrolase [Hamadaea tsunoensis]